MGEPQAPSRVRIESQDSARLLLHLTLVSAGLAFLLGIDLLAIVACFLLAALLSSRFLAKASLRGLRIHLLATEVRARCDEPVPATLTLSNRNRFLPLFHPTVSIREATGLAPQAFQYRGLVAPGSVVTLDVCPCLQTRGLQRLEACDLRSRFPYGLHEATAVTEVLSEPIVVWPRPAPLSLAALLPHPPNARAQAQGSQAYRSQDPETDRIRDYQSGDPKTRINWKLSAKRDKLTLIEPRAETQQRYELRLDSSAHLWTSLFAFERMVRLVATLVSEMRRRHCLSGVCIDDLHYPLANERDYAALFDALALLQPSARERLDAESGSPRQLWILPDPASGIALRSELPAAAPLAR